MGETVVDPNKELRPRIAQARYRLRNQILDPHTDRLRQTRQNADRPLPLPAFDLCQKRLRDADLFGKC
jgi:hypothetical protein